MKNWLEFVADCKRKAQITGEPFLSDSGIKSRPLWSSLKRYRKRSVGQTSVASESKSTGSHTAASSPKPASFQPRIKHGG
jgi:hypothetical protein